MESSQNYWGMQLKSYCTLIHLSQFFSIIAPGLGFIAPIVLWIAQKDRHHEIDKHGKVTINWIISFTIYLAVIVILLFAYVHVLGIILSVIAFILVMLLNFIFAVIATFKANDGKLWVYPLSIKFLKY
ncbi:DUF4870 domain-containing protein [Glaciecola sp. XM2]|uniref:DUF4870 domain-containing protein n=1 Tax=Glaciecola sp. XM2 TaxID=1914931 RepID=UPI00332066A5